MAGPTRRQFEIGLIGIAPAAPPRPEPSYLRLHRAGELERRAHSLYALYRSCRLCPRECGVDRTRGEKGVCNSTHRAKVFSAHAHFGEEPELVGRGGSGTVFFSNCNLLCSFCQNWEINHRGDGSPVSDESLARIFVGLQDRGCENINLVTPTHILPNIVRALPHAIRFGFRLPLVYNCGGYESVEALRLLDGIVDIYLPDYKYMDGTVSARLSSGAGDYPERAAAAIREMHRQVGQIEVDRRNVATRGLMIRHLVLPSGLSGTRAFARWVVRELGPDTYVNLMAQYRPEHLASRDPELSRRLTAQEWREALNAAREEGLRRLHT